MISSGYHPSLAKVATQPDHLHGNFPKEIPKDAPAKTTRTPKIAIIFPIMLSSVSRLVSFADSHRA